MLEFFFQAVFFATAYYVVDVQLQIMIFRV